MKSFLAFITFVLFYYSATAQKVYLQTFDKAGKLQKVELVGGTQDEFQYPSILTKGFIQLNTDSISVPDSKLREGASDLLTFKISDKKKVSHFWNMQSEILRDARAGLDTNIYIKRILPSLDKSVTGVTLFYDPTNGYFPIKTGNKRNAIKIENRLYKDDFDFDKDYTKIICVNTAKYRKVDYSITKLETDNEILANHLAATSGHYKGIPFDQERVLRNVQKSVQLQSLLINERILKDTIQQIIPMALGFSNDGFFNINVVKGIDQIKNEVKYIPAIYDNVMKLNGEWIKSWLWYTGGRVMLNPFDVTADTTQIIADFDTKIAAFEHDLKVRRDCIESSKADGCKFGNNTEEINSIAEYLRDLNINRRKAAKLGLAYKAWVAQKTTKSRIVYSGSWNYSRTEGISWMKHYDANKNFNMVKDSMRLPEMVASIDEQLIYVHNVKASDKIKLGTTIQGISLKSPLENMIEELTGQLGDKTIGGSLADIINPFSHVFIKSSGILPPLNTQWGSISTDDLIKSYVAKGTKCIGLLRELFFQHRVNYANRVEIIDKILLTCKGGNKADIPLLQSLKYLDQSQFVITLYEKLNIRAIDDYQLLVEDYMDKQAMLNWLLTQTKPPLELELEADENPLFRTVVEAPEKKLDVSKSSKISYSITLNEGKDPEISGSYKKYTQARFLPTIGLAYVLQDRTASIYDNKTGQFGSDTQFDNIEVFVGVKWYIDPTNPVADNRTRRLIRENIPNGKEAICMRGYSYVPFVTFGAGVRHKFLRNYNLGLGMDVIPGVSVHGGVNFIFHKFYNLQNGKLINEQERPKGYPYVSISFDPGIVTNLVKLLITK